MKEIQLPSQEQIAAVREKAMAKVQQWQLREKLELLRSLLLKAKSSIQSMFPKN